MLTIRRKKTVSGAQVEAQVLLTPIEIGLINACVATSRSSQELLSVAGYAIRTGNFKRSMEKLLTEGLLAMTIPEKPNSRNQRYVATAKGQKLLQSLNREGNRP